MVRLLYISGMVFFTVLIGDSAHRLHVLYQDGTLSDPYNSARKAAITLLAVSSCGLAGLCFAEMLRLKRRGSSNAVATFWNKEEVEPVAEEPGSTSIYAAPEVVDQWEERTPRITLAKSSRGSNISSLEMTHLWMSILRVYCGVLPVIYTYVILNYLFFWLGSGAANLLMSVLFPLLFLGSWLTAIGIIRKQPWGVKWGYALAIFHLLIFPFGTAAGFVMLIALMGAASEFELPRRRRRNLIRKARRRRAKHRKVPSAAL
jgi:hypothetical protein